jgi:hypothetical protein
MKTYKLKVLFITICAAVLFVQCADDDDNGNIINDVTCDDGIQNGDETGVDCGGSCEPCTGAIDFSGTYMQEDSMGRPAINTVFSGTDAVKNDYNVRIPTARASFQPVFQATLEAYHDVYAVSLGLDPADVNYETNILGLDATNFTTVLAQFDALQVAPNGQTVYYDGSTGVVLTGRGLEDDVIDISLTLMFGGADGMRFNGDATPQLTTDGVNLGDRAYGGFPYLETPKMN